MIYLLLPAYNEEDSIPNLFTKLETYFSKAKLDAVVVLLDDGSPDTTAETAKRYQGGLNLVILRHAINRGLGETARDLFEYAAENAADSDIIIRMDCDDTHDPEIIGKMKDLIQSGKADVVTASRFQKGGGMQGVSRYRALVSRGANVFMTLVFPIPGVREYSCGFRAYRGSLIKDAIKLYGNDFIQLKGLGFTGTLEKVIKLNLLGARFAEVEHWLHYDRKRSVSKMITSITTIGYLVMAVLYHWPFGGWRSQYRGTARSYRSDRKHFDRLVSRRQNRFRKVRNRL